MMDDEYRIRKLPYLEFTDEDMLLNRETGLIWAGYSELYLIYNLHYVKLHNSNNQIINFLSASLSFFCQQKNPALNERDFLYKLRLF